MIFHTITLQEQQRIAG